MCAQALNLWVFRDGRRATTGVQLKSALLDEVRRLSKSPPGNLGKSSPDHLLAALLRAGELECALADAGAEALQSAMLITERLAEALVAPGREVDSSSLAQSLEELKLPERLEVSPPEGFAYYALHPLSYAAALGQLARPGEKMAVIGIRSIGATLSAVGVAAARACGIQAERITVRPVGHPYNRRTRLSSEQAIFLKRQIARSAAFFVVDEGPGLSGSSFLSVAEALESTGVFRDKISLICSHHPDFNQLRTDNASTRAQRFRWISVSGEPGLPAISGDFLGGGDWRKYHFACREDWPASWVNFERLKYLSTRENGDSERWLRKFIGFGHYGDAVLARERRIADAGFGIEPTRESDGFASYSWIDGTGGRPMSAQDLSEPVIERLANYCAFRAQSFSVCESDIATLQQMAEHNLAQQEISLPVQLHVETPVIPDGRMQPHEWLLTPAGQMLKTDSGAHGDDHFFPGPCDIAWDLAGTIVEWGMTAAQIRYFLDRYRQSSGDDPSQRIADYTVTYSVFRRAYCLMAANALSGTEEQSRFELAARRYDKNLPRRHRDTSNRVIARDRVIG